MTTVPAIEPLSLSTPRRLRIPPLVLFAIAVTAVVLVFAFVGHWIAPQDPLAQDLTQGVHGPGQGHWLGTDVLGRDVFSRVIAGTRQTLIGPICIAIAATILGSSLGLIAGYREGVAGVVLNRFADFMHSIPHTLVIIVLVGVLKGTYWTAVGILIVFALPVQIRLVRSATAVQARLPYVDAARTLGLSSKRIMARHVLPNVAPTIVTTFLLDFVGMIVAFSGLAYLGLGVQPGSDAWGTMLSDGRPLLFVNPWVSMAPAIMIVLTAVSATLIGDWLYDRFSHGQTRR